MLRYSLIPGQEAIPCLDSPGVTIPIKVYPLLLCHCRHLYSSQCFDIPQSVSSAKETAKTKDHPLPSQPIARPTYGLPGFDNEVIHPPKHQKRSTLIPAQSPTSTPPKQAHPKFERLRTIAHTDWARKSLFCRTNQDRHTGPSLSIRSTALTFFFLPTHLRQQAPTPESSAT